MEQERRMLLLREVLIAFRKRRGIHLKKPAPEFEYNHANLGSSKQKFLDPERVILPHDIGVDELMRFNGA
jgi:hypothetical protein